jgi:hypothetical protein
MTELVRINPLITRAAYERIMDDVERRDGEMAMKPTIGSVIVRMAMKGLPESAWEEREALRPGSSPRKPAAAAKAKAPGRRRPAKAKSATRSPVESAQGAGGQ